MAEPNRPQILPEGPREVSLVQCLKESGVCPGSIWGGRPRLALLQANSALPRAADRPWYVHRERSVEGLAPAELRTRSPPQNGASHEPCDCCRRP